MRMRWGAASGAASAEPKASRNQVPASSVSLPVCIGPPDRMVKPWLAVHNGRRSLLTGRLSLTCGRSDLHRDFHAVPVAADRITILAARSSAACRPRLRTEPLTRQRPHAIKPCGALLAGFATLQAGKDFNL